MRHLPPVICWVGHHRGPAGCAVRGCRCKTVPLWSGSPPVQSQRGGGGRDTNNQSCCLKNDTWGTAEFRTKRQYKHTSSHHPARTFVLVLHCFALFSFPVLERPGEISDYSRGGYVLTTETDQHPPCFRLFVKGPTKPRDKQRPGAAEQGVCLVSCW